MVQATVRRVRATGQGRKDMSIKTPPSPHSSKSTAPHNVLGGLQILLINITPTLQEWAMGRRE